ncbi:MAG TPA: di-heme-cytochrome C peroxidase [Candidatus Sulfotelmatobacter sp.]|nr:di-heme-cytochrome C peroxidase [Candidatus Sulfotelmatobacter sp.]
MAKSIVICCDGTGNEFGESKSNVVKLYKMLVHDDSQVAYYHPGVGTMGARTALTGITRWWTKVIGLAFGYGISDNIADAYQFLMRTYTPGDTLYFLGFSRGAYTARALCGMLHIIGLLREDNEGLIPYSVRMLKSKKIDFAVAADFKRTFCRECKPHFVGVWDTVSSVGWIYNVAHFPGTKATHNPDLKIVRHAVAIDERRAFFRQNLFGTPHDDQQDIKEIWFAGVHSDVGGSYPESESQLSKIALQWMVCEAELAGLRIDQVRKADILGGKPPYVVPDPLTENQHESLKGAWWLAEFWPKIFSYPVPVAGLADPKWMRGIRINLGRARTIPNGVHIHQSVLDRIHGVQGYKPKNLPQQHIAEPQTSCELLPRPAHGQPTAAPPKQPLLRRPSIVSALALLAVIGVGAVIITIFTLKNSLKVPRVERPTEVAWLPQNWTEEQRRRYYHTAQGSELIPYAWFLALEQPRFTIRGAPPFRQDSYMQGFGFIPDSSSLENPDGLPVGFARDDHFVDPYTGQKDVVLGITCAACHTGELFFGRKAIRIDAGPSLIDLQKFTEALGLAVTWTYYDPVRFHRFANRVLGPDHSHADQVLLRRALKYYLDTSFTEFKATRHLFPTPEGYGRTDALARIGNFVFGTELNNSKNLVVGDGPVNFPPVWDASWMDWVQYNGSIQQPMGRNVGEALGVRSRINLLGYPGQQFQNTIHVDNLHEIELLLGGSEPGMGVWSPKWPEDILGKIDRLAAAKGEKLYNELCLHCHKSPMLSDEGRKPEHWSNTTPGGKQFFKVTMIPLDEIGTDAKQAQNFSNRTADSGPLGKGIVSARDGLRYITQKLIDQSYAELKLTPEQREEWNGYRENKLLAPLAYKARPHNGIWATPPYLHNGSVPNLFSLLSPVSERPKVFYLGSKQYDAVKLGLNTDPLEGAAEFRTELPGNSNAGHEFNDGPKGNGVIGRKLSPEERMEIIEYLKTL